MDPELFKQRLEEFAELRQMKVPKSPALREADEPEIIERHGQVLAIDVDDNPTIAWCIKRLKPRTEVCEDCCQLVEDRVIETKRYESPVVHWRKSCRPCGLIQNPYTKAFDVEGKKSHWVYSCFHKGMPEPNSHEKDSDLQPVMKKPTK